MKDTLFGKQGVIKAHALFVGQRLELKDFERSNRLGSAPLVVKAIDKHCAVLFRYGVVVYFGMDSFDEIARFAELKPFIREPFARHLESEEVEIVADRARSDSR